MTYSPTGRLTVEPKTNMQHNVPRTPEFVLIRAAMFAHLTANNPKENDNGK